MTVKYSDSFNTIPYNGIDLQMALSKYQLIKIYTVKSIHCYSIAVMNYLLNKHLYWVQFLKVPPMPKRFKVKRNFWLADLVQLLLVDQFGPIAPVWLFLSIFGILSLNNWSVMFDADVSNGQVPHLHFNLEDRNIIMITILSLLVLRMAKSCQQQNFKFL